MGRPIVLDLTIEGLEAPKRGKVRRVFDLGGEGLLIVATDNISAFDVIMPTGIPDKGRVLTQMSLFWFELTKDVCSNHLVTADTVEIIQILEKCGVLNARSLFDILDGRSMIVRKADPLPVECIVRGYISGSAWEEYKKLIAASPGAETVSLWGHDVPTNLKEGDKLPQPLFTPSTKAEYGAHDESISYEQLVDLIGKEAASEIREKSLAVYSKASDYARSNGIIIADTKFEFGVIGNEIILIDEVLTPDSSRFWEAATYEPGKAQPSFDKQYVRDWLREHGFTGEGEPPTLQESVVNKTREKYSTALYLITGTVLAA